MTATEQHMLDAASRADVIAGLRSNPKTLPSRLFYDARGAQLFDEITRLPEYYLTRAELSILEAHADDIARCIGECVVVEPGSGEGTKVRLLLHAMRDRGTPARGYVPIDVAETQLSELAQSIAHDFPETTVTAIVADFTLPSALSEIAEKLAHCESDARRVVFFPGSTIGNLHPHEAGPFLMRVRNLCGETGALILGTDLRKDALTLHAAYNDSLGVTADFNKNMLVHLNRELGADFDVARFDHYAFYNPVAARIEMHLVSAEDQDAHVSGETIAFARGESIWTEVSYKYDDGSMREVLHAGGWEPRESWRDVGRRFAVWYCEAL